MNVEQVKEIHREQRQIRVRFSAVGAGSDRYFLVRNRTRLRGSGLYIREWLTPFRQSIFQELTQLKRQGWVSTVFTRDGTVYVVENQRDRPRPVRSLAALERLIKTLSQLHDQTRPPGLQPPRSGSTDTAAPSETAVAATSVGSGLSGRREIGGGDGGAGCGQMEFSASEIPALQGGDTYTGEDRIRTTPGGHGSRRPDPWSSPAERRSPAGGSQPVASATQVAAAGRQSSADAPRVAPAERRLADDERRSATDVPRSDGQTGGGRPESATGVRRRFGGDIRRFVSVAGSHSKCD